MGLNLVFWNLFAPMAPSLTDNYWSVQDAGMLVTELLGGGGGGGGGGNVPFCPGHSYYKKC